MTITMTRWHPIWPRIRALSDLLSRIRDGDMTTDERAGVNQAIIFYSACCFEGVMETGLKALLARRRAVFNAIDNPDFEMRKTTNTLFTALEDDLRTRIARATGMKSYDDLFGLLADNRISRGEQVQPLWEGAQVLFQLRNVLAHGREISASRIVVGGMSDPRKEQYSGGYKKAEDYLLKCGLIDEKFMDADCEDLYFSDGIADHFWGLAQDLVSRVIDSLEPSDREAFKAAMHLQESKDRDEGP